MFNTFTMGVTITGVKQTSEGLGRARGAASDVTASPGRARDSRAMTAVHALAGQIDRVAPTTFSGHLKPQ
jgi:hypothetical protein